MKLYILENDGEELFPDEYSVWESGPVIPSVYKAYLGEELQVLSNAVQRSLTDRERQAIDLVLLMTKRVPTKELIDLSYGPVYVEDGRQIVSKESIYNYFFNRSLFELDLKSKTGKVKVKK